MKDIIFYLLYYIYDNLPFYVKTTERLPLVSLLGVEWNFWVLVNTSTRSEKTQSILFFGFEHRVKRRAESYDERVLRGHG